ncbi:MAG: phage baseplate upper protein [Pirellulales bacterium]|nr:phage baseplate upper protein [Pirellulales bacterium]
MTTYQLTVGDRLVPLRKQLVDRDGNPVDLTGSTVAFRMVNAAGTVKINNAAAVIESAATGEVRYDWAAGDVDTAGEFWGWFIRTQGGKTEHYPSGASFAVLIHPAT